MPLTPGYGDTPIPDDEWDALLPEVRELLGDSVTRVAVHDLEQAVQDQVAEQLLIAAFDGALTVDDLLVDRFVRDLHRRPYGQIWSWAGVFRVRELNIGVAPEQIAVELRGSIDTIRYRWENTEDWTPRQLGIAAHAETVRIHPFADGNGRTTRLLADLVFAAAQQTDIAEMYDWRLDKRRYIQLLREYDGHRDPTALAAFIGTRSTAS